MHEECRLQKQRDYIAPIDRPIEGIELIAIVEAVQHERNQAKDIKVDSARRIPAANKNKKTDEKVKKCSDPQVVFDRCGVLLRRGNKGGLKGLAIASNLIRNFHPRTHAP